MATIPTIGPNDNAGILRQSVNAAINAVNSGNTPSGGGGSSDSSNSTDRVLNILNIGNSHTEDAWGYVPYMLLEYGIKVRMMIWRAAGAGFGDINNCYTTRRNLGPNYKNSNGKIRYIDTTGDSGSELETWTDIYDAKLDGTSDYTSYADEDYTVQEAVLWNNTKWDLVIIQGNYGAMCEQIITDPVAPVQIIKKITADLSVTPLYGLQGVFTKEGEKDKGYMFASLANHHNLFNWLPFDIFFPGGTAIFNARQFTQITSVCDSDSLLASGDGIHLHGGLPCYIDSLACMEALFRRFYPQFTVMGDPTRVTTEWKTGKNIPDEQNPHVDTSEANAYLAQRIAVLSNDHPWDITDSSAETISKKETVKVTRVMDEGFWVIGALMNNQSTGGGSSNYQKHSYLGGKVCLINSSTQKWEGTLESVTWSMGGEAHNVPIENNVAYVLIKDICSDVTITVTGTASRTL